MYEIFLPQPSTPTAKLIDPASAVVGTPTGDEVTVYFESNRHDAVNLRRWSDRVECAAGRLQGSYPTVARATVPRAELHSVGWYDAETGKVLFHTPEEKAAVAAWCEESTEELETTTRAERRAYTDAALLQMAGGNPERARELGRRIGVRP